MQADPLVSYFMGSSYAPAAVERFYEALANTLVRAAATHPVTWTLTHPAQQQGLSSTAGTGSTAREQQATGTSAPAAEVAAVCIGYEYPHQWPSDWQLVRNGLVTDALRKAPSWRLLLHFPDLFAKFDALKSKFYEEHGRFFYIAMVGTAPEWQRRGLGRQLMTAVLQHADGLGIPSYLEANGDDSAAFYKTLGFNVIDAIQATHDSPTLHIMVRHPPPALTPPPAANA